MDKTVSAEEVILMVRDANMQECWGTTRPRQSLVVPGPGHAQQMRSRMQLRRLHLSEQFNCGMKPSNSQGKRKGRQARVGVRLGSVGYALRQPGAGRRREGVGGWGWGVGGGEAVQAILLWANRLGGDIDMGFTCRAKDGCRTVILKAWKLEWMRIKGLHLGSDDQQC